MMAHHGKILVDYNLWMTRCALTMKKNSFDQLNNKKILSGEVAF